MEPRKRSGTWQHGEGTASGKPLRKRAQSLELRRARPEGRSSVTVQLTVGLSATSISIDVESATTVEKLRRKVEEATGISQRAQMLTVDQRPLSSDANPKLLCEVAPEVFHPDSVVDLEVTVLRRCSQAQAQWLDMLEQGDEAARSGLFSGVARELQEVCDFTRLSRFRHVLQEHMMNDAHRYAYHRLRVHLHQERFPFGAHMFSGDVCTWLQQDENFLLMALEINTPAAEVQTPILLYGAREQIQKNLDLAKQLAGNSRVDPLVLADVAPQVLNDREFLLIAATRSGAILQLAPPELQQDLELVRACVSQSGSALRFVAPELKANKDIVLQAVSSTGLALEHVARDLRDDSEVVRRAVQTTGLALEFASDRLHGDRGVVLAAVGQDGCAIQFAAPQLRDDSEVVKQAVQASGQALKHVSERLRNHREVVVLAAKQHPQSLQYASTMLRSDLSTVMDAVSASFKAFEFASDVLQENLEVIRCAARQLLASHGIFVAADEQLPSAIEANVLLVSKESGLHLLAALQTGLLTSRSFGMAVVRNDPQMYRKLEAHVKADKEVSLEAVRRLPELFLDLPFLSRSDLDIQVAAVGQKPEMISFVLKTDVHRVLDALKVQKEKKPKVEWPSGAVATTAN